jgi:hypothetical protein
MDFIILMIFLLVILSITLGFLLASISSGQHFKILIVRHTPNYEQDEILQYVNRFLSKFRRIFRLSSKPKPLVISM